MENNFGQVELVRDIELGEGNSYPDIATGDNHIFFVAKNSSFRQERWVIERTTEETQLASKEVSFVRELTMTKNELFFAARSDETGRELDILTPDGSIETEIETAAINEDMRFSGASSIAFIRGADTSESIEGTATNEVIQGEGGDDIIAGRGGDDTLSGGAGEDILIGGVGSDRFVIELDSGIDKFIDFTQGEDQIALPSSLTFEQLSFDGNDIQFGDETLATVAFLDANNLIAADFTIAQ